MAEEPGTPVASDAARRKNARLIVPLVSGALCLAGWVALLAVPLAGADTDESALWLSVGLLVLVVVAAASTVTVRSAWRIVAIVSAALYAATLGYIRFGFDLMMPEAMRIALTAVFFLAPLVAGVAALVVGVRGRR